MSILKYFKRIERMHALIKKSSTGCSEEFARKMGLSRRQLLEDISELKSIGAPIKFSSGRNSYIYETDWNPFVNKLNGSQLNKITGGVNIYECSIATLPFNSIALPSVSLYLKETW